MERILISTQDEIAGYEICETLGVARGNIVIRATRNWLDFFSAELRVYLGGEIVEYTKLVSDARACAVKRMREDAESQEADAVVAVVMESDPEFLGRLIEIHAYGTAVKLRKLSASRKSPG